MGAWLIAAVLPYVLVYSYSYERVTTDQTEHAYGLNKMDPQGGFTQLLPNINQHHLPPTGGGYDPPEKRSGTISIEVVREQPDGGLVLRVSELPAQSAGAECVTFSNTQVVCDPNATFGPEALEIVSMLAHGFVDPARIDASRHWQLDLDGSVESTLDYRILHSRGSALEIEERGTTSPKGSPAKTLVDARIEYDAARELPTSVEEATVLRVQKGAIYETTQTYATFALSTGPPQAR